MIGVFIIIVLLVGAFIVHDYGCGEATHWPYPDGYKRIRYWLGSPDYVHHEDVPYEWQCSYDT